MTTVVVIDATSSMNRMKVGIREFILWRARTINGMSDDWS